MKKEDILDLGSARSYYFGGEYDGGIYLMQNPEEMWEFINEMSGKLSVGGSYLEIGSAAGGSCYLLNKVFRFRRIVLVDDNSNEFCRYRKKVLRGIEREEIIGNSHSGEVLDRVRKLGEKFDLIFIDGDHSYEGVKQDFEDYSEFLVPGGFIVLHDIMSQPGVMRYFQELINGNGVDFYGVLLNKENRHCGIGIFRRN